MSREVIHSHTLGSPARGVTRDLHGCRSLPDLAGADGLTGGDPADCPTTGHSPSAHLRALLLDADLTLARRADLRTSLASPPTITATSVTRAPAMWLDRLLADVLRGEETP